MKTNASDALEAYSNIFLSGEVKATYRHCIKRVFVEGSDKSRVDLAHTYSTRKKWEPTDLRKVGKLYMFSIPVQQMPMVFYEDADFLG